MCHELLFRFFKLFKNVKTILSVWFVKKQANGAVGLRDDVTQREFRFLLLLLLFLNSPYCPPLLAVHSYASGIAIQVQISVQQRSLMRSFVRFQFIVQSTLSDMSYGTELKVKRFVQTLRTKGTLHFQVLVFILLFVSQCLKLLVSSYTYYPASVFILSQIIQSILPICQKQKASNHTV